MLPDATDPFAVKVNGPDTVCPAGGVVKETVGASGAGAENVVLPILPENLLCEEM